MSDISIWAWIIVVLTVAVAMYGVIVWATIQAFGGAVAWWCANIGMPGAPASGKMPPADPWHRQVLGTLQAMVLLPVDLLRDLFRKE